MSAKHPRPCDCGCGVMLAQPRNGGPRRFVGDTHARRLARSLESAEDYEKRMAGLREKRRQKLAASPESE